jgi:glutamate dehydrogenase (NADP+)
MSSRGTYLATVRETLSSRAFAFFLRRSTRFPKPPPRTPVAFPCATHNEIDGAAAERLVANGCTGVFEGANMPSTRAAIAVFESNGVIFGPSKAANAGGVAVAGLEMAQNAAMTAYSRDDVDARLQAIMAHIHAEARAHALQYGATYVRAADGVTLANLKDGANIAAFLKVASAMQDQGAV